MTRPLDFDDDDWFVRDEFDQRIEAGHSDIDGVIVVQIENDDSTHAVHLDADDLGRLIARLRHLLEEYRATLEP